jgi:hypothetical protein
MQKITPIMARAVLVGAHDRAKRMGKLEQVMRLRSGSLLRVLAADPSLIVFEQLVISREFVPTYEGWRIVPTEDVYEGDQRRREKVIFEVGGGYLLPAESIEAEPMQ